MNIPLSGESRLACRMCLVSTVATGVWFDWFFGALFVRKLKSLENFDDSLVPFVLLVSSAIWLLLLIL
jgi:hypothetical protein